MRFSFYFILICILLVVVSGCTNDDYNQFGDKNLSFNGSNLQSSPKTTNTTNSPISPVNSKVSGKCYHVVDGDTIDVENVGRVRLVGVNTPERGDAGYENATKYVKSMCLGKIVSLDVDNDKNKDKYGRTLAVVYVDGVNLNEELLKKGYAEVMYIPPSEFNPYDWT